MFLGRLRKPLFIYAEDDQNSVILLRAALRKLGAEECLTHSPDGDALIMCLRDSIISRTLPAFVLLDLRMPRMGGFDALRWIRVGQGFWSTTMAKLGMVSPTCEIVLKNWM